MRIDAYNQIAQLYDVQKTYNSPMSKGRPAMGSDQLSISQTAYSYQSAKAAVSEAPDVRADKIARLKAQIQAGTYSVDPEDFANKLLGQYNMVF